MRDTLPPLPEPFDYCYEWDGPYGTRKFSTAPHNGRQCNRSVPIFRAEQLRAYGEACRAATEPVPVCARCNGTGVVDDGEIDCYPDGTPFDNGPVKCVKDCPACRAAPSPTETRADQWIPIETAPKDAECLILTDGEIVTPGGWVSDMDHGAEWEGQLRCAGWWTLAHKDGFRPTGWQPLPPPGSAAPSAPTPETAQTLGCAGEAAEGAKVLGWYDPENDRIVTASQMNSLRNHQGAPGRSAAKTYTVALLAAPSGQSNGKNDPFAPAAALRMLIADDAYAATFQTFGQYRTALLRTIDAATAFAHASAPAEQKGGEEPPELTQVLDALRLGRLACEWSGKSEEAAKIAAAFDAARALASGGGING